MHRNEIKQQKPHFTKVMTILQTGRGRYKRQRYRLAEVTECAPSCTTETDNQPSLSGFALGADLNALFNWMGLGTNSLI